MCTKRTLSELICFAKKMHLDFRLIPCARNENFRMTQRVSYGQEMLP